MSQNVLMSTIVELNLVLGRKSGFKCTCSCDCGSVRRKKKWILAMKFPESSTSISPWTVTDRAWVISVVSVPMLILKFTHSLSDPPLINYILHTIPIMRECSVLGLCHSPSIYSLIHSPTTYNYIPQTIPKHKSTFFTLLPSSSISTCWTQQETPQNWIRHMAVCQSSYHSFKSTRQAIWSKSTLHKRLEGNCRSDLKMWNLEQADLITSL